MSLQNTQTKNSYKQLFQAHISSLGLDKLTNLLNNLEQNLLHAEITLNNKLYKQTKLEIKVLENYLQNK